MEWLGAGGDGGRSALCRVRPGRATSLSYWRLHLGHEVRVSCCNPWERRQLGAVRGAGPLLPGLRSVATPALPSPAAARERAGSFDLFGIAIEERATLDSS
jgi:hypothetical protein